MKQGIFQPKSIIIELKRNRYKDSLISLYETWNDISLTIRQKNSISRVFSWIILKSFMIQKMYFGGFCI